MKPLVTVVVPSTSSRIMQQMKAFETVVNQTYEHIDMIVISGKEYTAPEARNIGWRRAKGKYIAFLDDDDEWHPDKIKKQVEYMEDNFNCSLCITGSLDRRFNQVRVCMPKEYPSHRDIIKSFNLSSTSSYLIRKDAYPLVKFREDMPASQEYDLAIELSKHGHIKCIQEILMFQNSTPGQISTNWKRKIKGVVAIYNFHKGEYNIIDKVKTVGLISVFLTGFIFGTRIYKILNKFKEMYENEGF